MLIFARARVGGWVRVRVRVHAGVFSQARDAVQEIWPRLSRSSTSLGATAAAGGILVAVLVLDPTNWRGHQSVSPNWPGQILSWSSTNPGATVVRPLPEPDVTAGACEERVVGMRSRRSPERGGGTRLRRQILVHRRIRVAVWKGSDPGGGGS